MPLAEDEAEWSGRNVVFATAKGNVRRNALSDFANVFANGKIAMKFEGEDADDRLIAAAICTEKDDILLATRNGRCIRFPVGDVRVFTGRTSVGVRGIRLDDRATPSSRCRSCATRTFRPNCAMPICAWQASAAAHSEDRSRAKTPSRGRERRR